MDFRRSDDQAALAGLARQVFADEDKDPWAGLAETGILGAVVPSEHGGARLGLLELLGVLEEQGRAVAHAPVVPTLVLGALPIARFGTPEQRAALLPGVADGSTVLTAALEEVVPYAAQAHRILVPAGDEVWIVDPADLSMTEVATTNGQPAAMVDVGDAPGEVIPGLTTAWLRDHGAAAICAVQAGVCAAALAMTAEHARTRVQFGKAIGEFQAVAQRAADAFIDAEMVRLTAYQAIFRLAQGWPAAHEVAVAKFWAGDGGMRVVHAAQHLHGGLGVDTDYPLHRYFLWAKQNEHTLGTPTRELIRLGAALAAEPI